MDRTLKFLIMLLLFTCTTAGALDVVENPKDCQQCGMSRVAYPRSRLLITYADGTIVGLCSLNCAANDLRQHSGKEIRSLQVADYSTMELTDARKATWVVGGNRPGVMTALPKWAFATMEGAQTFIKENGGEISSFDQVLQMANKEIGASSESHHQHKHDHMGAGGQMLFNPAFGDDVYHTHPAGMWMANYKFIHTVQKGLRNGTTDVPADNATPVGNRPFGFMMAPTGMTMDMHMLMVMYGVTERLTLMGMASYMDNEMEMVMNMGMGNRPDSPMRTSGPGDTELRGIYQISPTLTGSLGVSIPTGDIDQDFVTMGTRFRAPYDMQLGSGTVDLKPALTYSTLSADAGWNWGGQASYTYHVDRNSNSYTLGDNAKVTGWLQRAFGPATTWLRLAYNYTASISGRDPEIDKLLDPVTGASTPDADPGNYGGHRVDGFLGASFAAGPFSIGVEGGLPFYQNLNGLQLKNDWYLTAGIQGMF